MRNRNSLGRSVGPWLVQTLSLILCVLPTQAATRNVPGQYPTIQAAIDGALAGDEVVVADGVYTGTSNRNLDFHGKAITVRGGSGNAADCVIDCEGSGRGFYFHSGETAVSEVKDLTIRNGYVTSGSPGSYYGGGVYCSSSSSPTLTNCTISGNSASSGGGVCCSFSSPALTHCTISGNTVINYGGGLYCYDNASPTLTDCTLSEGNASSGGGMYCSSHSGPTLTNCAISDNTVTGYGGGVHCASTSPTLTRCRLSGNRAHAGGGVYISSANPTLTNCGMWGNIANYGGGLSIQNSASPALTNCTITGNTASLVGGGLSSESLSSPLLTNCILWGDSPQEVYAGSGTPAVTYCDVQGGYSGAGNINVDPSFAFPDDFHLLTGSSCIDAGTNSPGGGLPSTDIDGTARPLDGNGDGQLIADLGAYEFNPTTPVIAIGPVQTSLLALEGTETEHPRTVSVGNCGGGTLAWTLTWAASWLQASPVEGESTGEVDTITLTADATLLAPGNYTTTLTVTALQAINSPRTVEVALYVGRALSVPGEYPTIQAAIDAAVTGDAVVVADGVYTGTGNKNLDFHGKAITVRGGCGNSVDCVIDCESSGRGFYFHSGETAVSEVKGLTIRNGYVTSGSPGSGYGGGVYCSSGSSPTLTNCTISESTASYGGGVYCVGAASRPALINCTISGNASSPVGAPGFGGGLYCDFSSPTLTNCTISGNTATSPSYDISGGGGVYCTGSASWPTLTNCKISGNTATNNGGGVYCYNGSRSTLTDCTIGENRAGSGGGVNCCSNSSMILTRCTIGGNTATSSGGGMDCASSSVTLTNCTISENTASSSGGGVCCHSADPTMTRCTLSGNRAYSGGGVYCTSASPTLTNCVVEGNTANYGGGVSNENSSDPTLTNCTISGNAALYGGGVGCWSFSSPSLTNCILWGDSPQEVYAGSGTPAVTYCDVQGGYSGAGNINVDPGFAFPDDFHLLPGSSCIDAGTNSPGGGLPSTDIDGTARPLDGNGDGQLIADLGAYEFNATAPAIAINQSQITFFALQATADAPAQTLLIRNCGTGALAWSLAWEASWLQASPEEGESTGEEDAITLTADATLLTPGKYTTTLTLTALQAINSPRTVEVALYVGRALPVPGEYPTIQAAIDAAVTGDEVVVADGVYTGTGNKDLDFHGKAITVQGSSGNATDCVIDCESSGRGFYFHSGETAVSEVRNLTIRNGYVTSGSPGSDDGGGVYCSSSSSPTLTNCTISGSTASAGGGVYCYSSSPTMTHCTISGSTAAGSGGGVACEYFSSPRLTDCTISENTASSVGGGVYCWSSSSPVLTSCTIIGNGTSGLGSHGGGMGCKLFSNPTLTNCTIAKNKAFYPASGGPAFDGSGGGLYCDKASPTLTGCTIDGNTASNCGGGISNKWSSSPMLINCMITGNTAAYTGGGVGNVQSSPTLTNCTIHGNSALYGGGMDSWHSTPTLTNCILWGDTPQEVYVDKFYSSFTPPVMAYCDVRGGWSGEGNIDVYPRLTPDGHLTAGASCIDAGDNSAVPAGVTTDRDGDPRFVDDPTVPDAGHGAPPIVDIGADEYADADEDGLPDWWELKYFGSATLAAPNADPDGDGLTNWQEYVEYGSNPVVPPYYVDGTIGDDGYDGRAPNPQGGNVGPKKTIQAALTLAQSGETVLVAAGTYGGPGNFNLDFANKAVVVWAPCGPGSTTIDCGSAGRAIDLASTTGGPIVLEGVTITGGAADAGAGLKARDSRLMLRHCVLDLNAASTGAGGIRADRVALDVDDLTIGSNAAPINEAGAVFRTNLRLLGPLGIPAGTMQAVAACFDGPGAIDLGRQATLKVSGLTWGATPTMICSNVTGTGRIVIDTGQELLLNHGAVVDLSGETGSGCADPDEAENWGRIEVNGQLVVRDSTIRNTNVDVLSGNLTNGTIIHNNQINLIQNPPGWGGKFFVEGTSTIECNVVYSEGDRYLDLDPDLDALPRPTIGQNKFYVNILQGAATPQGELLELRAVDHDNALGGGMSGAYELSLSAGYDETWALERLEVRPGAKVNLTNRQGFVFQDPQIAIPEAIYVGQLKLHPNAVLNTGMQRLYYQNLVGENGQTLMRDPEDPFAPMSNGSRIVDVPLLGFSLKTIAMEDETEFVVRVGTRLSDPTDEQPQQPPFKEGAIERLSASGGVPTNQAMRMRTRADESLQASSVAAHGAFARAGEDQIIVVFDYLFSGQATDELIVYLSDLPEVGNPASASPTHYVEAARVYPPLSGRSGSIGSEQFATFFGKFPRGSLNFSRGTYVELELRGPDACVWIDNWDPQVQCITRTCGDFDADSVATGIDFLYVLGEYGEQVDVMNTKWCLDVTSGDHYVDMDDIYAWDTRLHDPENLNLCGSNFSSRRGGQDKARGTPLSLPPNSLIIAGKQSGQQNGGGQQSDFLYVTDLTQVSVQVNGSTATTIVSPDSCQGSPLTPASDPNGSGEYRGNGRLIRDSNGAAYQMHGVQGLIRLSDAAKVVPYGQVPFDSNTVQIGLNPENGNGVPVLDVVFDPNSNSVLYVVPVQVTTPGGQKYKAAAKLQLGGGSPPYTVLQLYGRNPYTDSRVTVSSPYDQVVFEPDFQQLREVEIDTHGKLFVVSAQADNDNDWVLVYDQAVGNTSERCILLSGAAPACCSAVGGNLQAPTAMTLSPDGGTMYMASSVNAPDATDTLVHRLTINRSGNSVTGLTSNGVIEVHGMRHISSIVSRPTSSEVWVLGSMAPPFNDDTTFGDASACSQNPNNCWTYISMWPMLAVVPPNATSAVAAPLTCNDLAMPMSALFTSQTCGTGDFDDGGVGMSDVGPFVDGLLDSNPPASTVCTGDMNHDGILDGGDVQPFVNALLAQ